MGQLGGRELIAGSMEGEGLKRNHDVCFQGTDRTLPVQPAHPLGSSPPPMSLWLLLAVLYKASPLGRLHSFNCWAKPFGSSFHLNLKRAATNEAHLCWGVGVGERTASGKQGQTHSVAPRFHAREGDECLGVMAVWNPRFPLPSSPGLSSHHWPPLLSAPPLPPPGACGRDL